MAGIKLSEQERREAENIELRSYQLREILGQVPKWVIRNGTLMILGILLVLVVGAQLLKYPDILSARIRLTTEIPPADLNAKVSGKIAFLAVADKSRVQKGQVLAVFESAAKYTDIVLLQELLGEDYDPEVLVTGSFPGKLVLGPVQDAYAVFQKRIQEYSGFLRLNYHRRKILSVSTELNKYNRFIERLNEQEEILSKDYTLTQRQYSRDSLLFTQGVISSSQLEKSEAQKLSKLNEWKDIQTQLASAQIEVSNLEQEILELELTLEENSREHLDGLREAYERLNGQLSLWQEKYLLLSPFDGQVSFTRVWSENQYVAEGEVVLTVLPVEQGNIIGKVELSATGAGKVEERHRVIIRLDNYPYMEFGTLSGRIASISLVPAGEEYIAEVSLDSSILVTNYGIRLDFQQNMPGYAEIITDQRSLLERIIDPFRSAYRRQKTLYN